MNSKECACALRKYVLSSEKNDHVKYYKRKIKR